MKRMKKHKIKREKPETSTSYARESLEHDLAYYIHDRVELMHQVFSVLKPKDLKAMAPECTRRISIDDLQELCTEELLGISSKRLCAILDGAEPPSDTESSSPSPSPQLETISLDSISSDEEILSQASSKKKKHKHKRRDSKSKKASKEKKSKEPEDDVEKSKASRAGLTVLELLELQARARAIRAQLQKEQVAKVASETVAEPRESDNDEVEIKEEPAEVVEISSEDEKPCIEELEKANPPATNKDSERNNETAATESTNEKEKSKSKKDKSKKDKKAKKKKDGSKETEAPKETSTEIIKEVNTNKDVDSTPTVTKRINDLIITVPQQSNRKIKLNRNKVTITLPKALETVTENRSICSVVTKPIENVPKVSSVITKPVAETVKKVADTEKKSKEKPKKVKKKDKRKSLDNSDHDEITLQLSDSEKMDLLEDFDRKDYERVSSSSDSESSSSSDSSQSSDDNKQNESIEETSKENNVSIENEKDKETVIEEVEVIDENNIIKNKDNAETEPSASIDKTEKEKRSDETETNEKQTEQIAPIEKVDEDNSDKDSSGDESENQSKSEKQIQDGETPEINNKNDDKSENMGNGYISTENETTEVIEITNINDIPLQQENTPLTEEICNKNTENVDLDKNSDHNKVTKETSESNDEKTAKDSDKDLSEGELTDRESSEVEAFDLKPEVVCISDDETSKKKKKKKDKKSKKDKKKKSKSDFRESCDQNFYKDTIEIDDTKLDDMCNDDVYEILELSDDSSCYEVEGTVLSKEPTAEEITALSAKIDEIEREEIITDEQIREHERELAEKEKDEEIENISWKDRYLDSKKVKKVLTTANILNALRKKNRELKKKFEESKNKEAEVEKIEEQVETTKLVEGTLEHYNTLEGSTKFVDPVVEIIPETENKEKSEETRNVETETQKIEIQVTGEMKKDAKQLLKMYKKLLKYNDMTKQRDPNKKKSKKKKKQKDVASDVNI